MVPYDDLPDTDEPLVELENADDDSHRKLWRNSSSMLNLISEKPTFKVDSTKPAEKIPNLSDPIKGLFNLLEIRLKVARTNTHIYIDCCR